MSAFCWIYLKIRYN